MSTNTNIIDKPLPREMQQHTYSIMHRVEETHWWFVGRRKIIESFLKRVCAELKSTSRNGSLNILDVGCGTGANLEMLSQFGQAEGVAVDGGGRWGCRIGGGAQGDEQRCEVFGARMGVRHARGAIAELGELVDGSPAEGLLDPRVELP